MVRMYVYNKRVHAYTHLSTEHTWLCHYAYWQICTHLNCLDHVHTKYYICRKKPCNAAIQYEPQVMSDEDATVVMQSEEVVDFMKTVCPR